MSKLLQIVVVVRDKPELSIRCIESVRRNTDAQHPLLIVDDGSEEYTANELRKFVGEGCVLHRVDKPIGYSACVNVAIGMTGGDIVALTPDTVVFPGWITAMTEARDAASGKTGMVTTAGTIPLAQLEYPKMLEMPRGTNALYLSRAMRGMAEPVVNGFCQPLWGCMLIRRAMLDAIGGLNADRYPAEGSDSDLWMRGAAAGWTAALATRTFVYKAPRDTSNGSHHLPTLIQQHPGIIKLNREFAGTGIIEKFRKEFSDAAKAGSADRERVIFVVHRLIALGGVMDALNQADALILSGRDADVANIGPIDDMGRMMTKNSLFCPMGFVTAELARTVLPKEVKSGVVVAATAGCTPAVSDMCATNPDLTPIFWCQDDEMRFWTDEMEVARKNHEIKDELRANDGIFRTHANYNRGFACIAVSKFAADAFEKHSGGSHCDAVIPLGINPHVFRPRAKVATPTVIAFTRSEPRKGQRVIGAVFSMLRMQYGDGIQLLTIGGSTNISVKGVRHLGLLDPLRVAQEIAQAHVLIEPSEYQGFGLPALEGMAAGTAVVSFPNLGIDEYGKNGENCIIVPQGNVAEMARAVRRMLMIAKPERAHLESNGRRDAECFTWDAAAEKWNAALDAIRAREVKTTPKMDDPLVSVIIPAWNEEKYLGPCFDSLRNQTYPNIEIVLADDGSTDKTPDFAARADKYVRINHGGVSKARNAGIAAATGKYLLFADADSVTEKCAAEIMVRSMERDNSDLCYCDVQFHGVRNMTLQPGPVFTTEKLLAAPYIGGFYMVRRDASIKFDEDLTRLEDYEALIRLAKAGAKAVYVPATLNVAWQRKEGLSGTDWNDKSFTENMAKIKAKQGNGKVHPASPPPPKIAPPLPPAPAIIKTSPALNSLLMRKNRATEAVNKTGKLRVVHVTCYELTVGGTQRMIADWCKHDGDKFDVHIVAPGKGSNWTEWKNCTLHEEVSYAESKQYVADLNPDLVIHHFCSSDFGRYAGCPVIFCLHGELLFHHPIPDWVTPVAIFSNLPPPAHVALTWRKDLITVQPLGVDLEEFCQRPKRDPATCKEKRLVAAIVARISEEKIPVNFLQAIIKWGNPGNKWALRLIGKGIENEYTPYLNELVSKTRWIELVGDVPHDKMSETLNEVDVLLVPSRHESGSYAIVEAMAKGIPVIASDVGGIPFQTGGAAKLFPLGRYDVMLAYLKAHEDPIVRNERGVASRAEAEKRHRVADQVAARTKTIMECLAPKISVVIPVYNTKPEWMTEMFASLMSQTFRSWETIFVDDGSANPETLKYLKSIKDARCKVLYRAHGGLGETINAGLNAASCELVARMDSDDIMLPNRFQEQYAYMLAHPECDILGSQIECFDHVAIAWNSHHPAVITREVVEEQLRRRSVWFINHPAIIYRKSRILGIGGYDPTMPSAEDLDLWLRCSRAGFVIHNLPAIHVRYRLYHGQNSRSGKWEKVLSEVYNKYGAIQCKTSSTQPQA